MASAGLVAKSSGKNQCQLYGQSQRSYRRIKASLDGRFCQLSSESHSLSTLLISEGGLLFLADREIAVGSLIDLTLMLPDSGGIVSISGRVVNSRPGKNGRFQTAIRFVEVPGADRHLMTQYIRSISPAEEKDVV